MDLPGLARARRARSLAALGMKVRPYRPTVRPPSRRCNVSLQPGSTRYTAGAYPDPIKICMLLYDKILRARSAEACRLP